MILAIPFQSKLMFVLIPMRKADWNLLYEQLSFQISLSKCNPLRAYMTTAMFFMGANERRR